MVTPNPMAGMPSQGPIVVNQPPSMHYPGQEPLSQSYFGQPQIHPPPQQQIPPPSQPAQNPYMPQYPQVPQANNNIGLSQTVNIPSSSAPKIGGGAPFKKDATYYKAIGEAKKKAQNAMSELDFSNINNAIKFLKDAIATIQPYETQ